MRPARSVALEIGPLSVLLVRGDGGDFLLTGTVTPATLRQAADRRSSATVGEDATE